MDINKRDESKSLMQNVKQRFFAFRNGIVADNLRKTGSTYRIIFGLNLPQLKEIATFIGENRALADELWANSSTRESRLLAPMLVDPNVFALSDAKQWISDFSGNIEEIDILCHSLLNKVSFRDELIDIYRESGKACERYLALRLAFGWLGGSKTVDARSLAEKEATHNDSLTKGIARQLYDDASYLLED